MTKDGEQKCPTCGLGMWYSRAGMEYACTDPNCDMANGISESDLFLLLYKKVRNADALPKLHDETRNPKPQST